MRNSYLNEVKALFNDIGLLYDTEVVRLIGYAESSDDCYYIVQKPHFEPDDGIEYCSMVGAFVSLKPFYVRYTQLEIMFSKVWCCPPQKEFLVKEISEE